jgi:hypothetical protein
MMLAIRGTYSLVASLMNRLRELLLTTKSCGRRDLSIGGFLSSPLFCSMGRSLEVIAIAIVRADRER